MDIAGVKKMILVDFVEYNQMKRRLQAFLDKEVSGTSSKKESKDQILRKETIASNIPKNVESENENSIADEHSTGVEVEKHNTNNTPKEILKITFLTIQKLNSKLVLGNAKVLCMVKGVEDLELPTPGVPLKISYIILGWGGVVFLQNLENLNLSRKYPIKANLENNLINKIKPLFLGLEHS